MDNTVSGAIIMQSMLLTIFADFSKKKKMILNDTILMIIFKVVLIEYSDRKKQKKVIMKKLLKMSGHSYEKRQRNFMHRFLLHNHYI